MHALAKMAASKAPTPRKRQKTAKKQEIGSRPNRQTSPTIVKDGTRGQAGIIASGRG